MKVGSEEDREWRGPPVVNSEHVISAGATT